MDVTSINKEVDKMINEKRANHGVLLSKKVIDPKNRVVQYQFPNGIASTALYQVPPRVRAVFEVFGHVIPVEKKSTPMYRALSFLGVTQTFTPERKGKITL